MELKALQQERRRLIEVPLADESGKFLIENDEAKTESFAVWHKPLTPAFIAEIDAIEGESNMDRVARKLAAILTRWEITQDGQPTEPTYETLRQCEWETLSLIFNQLFEPVYPKKAT